MKALGVLLAILVCGCHRRNVYYQPPTLEGIQFVASSTVVDDTVEIWLTIINRSPSLRQLAAGPPELPLEVTSVNPDAAGILHKWTLADMLKAEETRPRIYAPVEWVWSIEPGTYKKTRVVQFAVKRILGDSLPSGRYRIKLHPGFHATQMIDAGEIELRAPRA